MKLLKIENKYDKKYPIWLNPEWIILVEANETETLISFCDGTNETKSFATDEPINFFLQRLANLGE